MRTVAISAKVDRERERPLVRAAAETSGVTVSAFMRVAVLEAARKRLAELTAEQ